MSFSSRLVPHLFFLSALGFAGCSLLVDPGQYEGDPDDAGVVRDSGHDAGTDAMMESDAQMDAGCTASSCASGLVCSDAGTCVAECVRDEDCPNEGESCVSGACVPLCDACASCSVGDPCDCDVDGDGFFAPRYAACAAESNYPYVSDCDDSAPDTNPANPVFCGGGATENWCELPASQTIAELSSEYNGSHGGFPLTVIASGVAPGTVAGAAELYDDLQLVVLGDTAWVLYWAAGRTEPRLAEVPIPVSQVGWMNNRLSTASDEDVRGLLRADDATLTPYSVCIGAPTNGDTDTVLLGALYADDAGWLARTVSHSTASVDQLWTVTRTNSRLESGCRFGSLGNAGDTHPVMVFTVQSTDDASRSGSRLAMVPAPPIDGNVFSSDTRNAAFGQILDPNITGTATRNRRALAIEENLVVVADPPDLRYASIDQDGALSGVEGLRATWAMPDIGTAHSLVPTGGNYVTLFASHNPDAKTLVTRFATAGGEWSPGSTGSEESWVITQPSAVGHTDGTFGQLPIVVELDGNAVVMTIRHPELGETRAIVFDILEAAQDPGILATDTISALAVDSSINSAGRLQIVIAAIVGDDLVLRVLRFCGAS